ncbi:hypothetical protein [Lysobacter gummosus]|uniref:hypothetical protein n=1 Tax=Lysobacter gummosus TaxID=262324 RepID=UPI0036260C23
MVRIRCGRSTAIGRLRLDRGPSRRCGAETLLGRSPAGSTDLPGIHHSRSRPGTAHAARPLHPTRHGRRPSPPGGVVTGLCWSCRR